MRIILAFFICLLLCLTEGAATTETTLTTIKDHSARYEEHASNILDEALTQIRVIWDQKRELFFNLTNGRGYNRLNHGPIEQEIENNYRHLVYHLAANLSTIPIVELKNQTLRRQVKRLSKLQLRGLDEKEFRLVKNKLHTIQTFLNKPQVCHIKHVENCTEMVKMVPGILKEITTINDLSDLNYYWLQWRETINNRDTAKNAFYDYIQLLRRAAAYNGHVTPSRTWYLYYESENFQQELEDVVWEIMPLYRELHAYLRNNAIVKYGERLTESDGTIPAPVLEQMIHEDWLSPTVLQTPYPDFKLPSIMSRLEEIMESADKVQKKAAEYFESLGLNRMSREFYAKFSRHMNANDVGGSDCKSEIYYFPPDVGLRYCTELDYRKLVQMHGKMAELQYNLYLKNLPLGLDREPCPGFGSALAETAVIASGSPRHLGTIRVLSNLTLSPENVMNRLFRLAVHTIIAIPQYYINDRFLVDVLDGRIGKDEMNCGYWKLQYKFAGVKPPKYRTEQHFDPDYKFYQGLNPEKSHTIKFLSEVLGLSLYRAFCLASNSYRPGKPAYPLHNCDYYNSTKAGDMMKEIMQLGATRHWRDIMAIATGERKLSGKGVMEYFAPLYVWLLKQNKEKGFHVGWDEEFKCVGN